MDYFKIFNFRKEPFSNSPDPEFFFDSRQHRRCLQQLELSLSMRRGLNVVIGDVGTGKTTLCRQFIRKFATDEKVETHLILDPSFNNPLEFLSTVAGMFLGEAINKTETSQWQLKERIKQYLFARGVDEKKTIVLIIDEGQEIPPFCLEILREFLNYETNEYKLLQIVIFAQKEFENTLKKHTNFADRINTYHLLDPLNFRDTRAMIRFRLKRASEGSDESSSLFSYPAIWSVYRATQGYPRKIIHLCHLIILTLIIQDRSRAGWFLVRSCVKRVFTEPPRKWRWATVAALTGLVTVALMVGLVYSPFKTHLPWRGTDEVSSDTQFVNGQISAASLVIPKPITVATPGTLTKSSAKALDENLTGTGPEEPAKTLIQKTSFPKLLGQVTVKKRETVYGMIQKIYGDFKYQYLKSVAGINPHIKDLDIIKVGEVIHFPAVHFIPEPLPYKGCWVQITQKKGLEDAYQFLRAYPKEAPAAHIVPYWNNPEGLKFAIVLKNYFTDEKSARSFMSLLPPMIASSSKILTQWKEGTVHFKKLY